MKKQDHAYEIRALSEADSEDIIEIARHTWEGHDYLTHTFRKWFDDEYSHPVGLVINGHIAALANLKIIDYEKTGWMEALRVHPKYRGMGLASTITKYVVKMAQDLGAAQIRYTTASDNVQSLHLASSVGMKVKFGMGIFWQETVSSITWRHNRIPVRQITFAEVPQELYNSDMFPYDMVVHSWKAFNLSPESLKEISTNSSFWIQEVNGEILSFSIGGERFEGENNYWSISVYAKNSETFLDQLSMHLDIATKEKLGFFGAYPSGFMNLVSTLEWPSTKDNPEEEDMQKLVLERVL